MKRGVGKPRILLEVGAAIRNRRIEKGLSQEELAFRCGLHRTYVGAVERGERNISILSLKKIADAIGVPVSQLFVPKPK